MKTEQAPVLNTLHQLERNIKSRREAYRAYEGFALRRQGDVLISMYGPQGRWAIRIAPDGTMARTQENYIGV